MFKGAKKAAAPKKPVANFAALMAEADEDDAEEEEEEEEAVPTPKKEDKKEKEKKEKKDKDDKKPQPPPKVDEIKLPEMGVEEKKVLKELLKSCVFQGVVVGLVKKCDKHPKADNLMCVEVSDGGFMSATVITNAKNVEVGLKVAFAPVGADVFDEELGSGTTTVKAVKLKGLNSAGMLCSQKLLGLGDEDGVAMVFPADCPLGIDVGEAFYRIVKPEAFNAGKEKIAAERKKAEEEAAARAAANAEKKAAAAAKKAAEGPGDEAGKKEDKKKEVKVNAKVAALQEHQAKLRAQQELIERIEREAREAAEEALRKMNEEEAAAAKRREEKKARQKAKEEQLKKEGKLLSKKQKEQQAKNEAFRKQLEAQVPEATSV